MQRKDGHMNTIIKVTDDGPPYEVILGPGLIDIAPDGELRFLSDTPITPVIRGVRLDDQTTDHRTGAEPSA